MIIAHELDFRDNNTSKNENHTRRDESVVDAHDD